MSLGARLTLAAACLVGSAIITWAIYDPAVFEDRPAPVVRARLVDSAPGAKSTLWLLAVGVSRYRDPTLRLDFADRDANEIARALRSAAAGGGYREVRTLVLTNEEVTRESLLDGLSTFLGDAGPDDVAALFFAGHGVRDLSSGSYYFLPYTATSANLLTEGLRMSDFDEMLRIVRRNVRATVVMLDTCHAGALGASGGEQVVSADEVAGQISAGEGFFLLAASRPGEESKENRDLEHGAFTFSILEGLAGKADSDGDGALSVSELFGYVAKRVPKLTGGQQHPYHKTEGTDLVLVSTNVVATGEEIAAPARAPAPRATVVANSNAPAPELADPVNSIAVLEFENLRSNREFDWISKALRVAFDTELSKVNALRVFSPELIDHTTRVRGADSLYTARELGVARLLTGSFHVTGTTLRIDARIIDAGSGVNEASDSVEGDLDTFFNLQKQLVLSMLRRLRVNVSAAEGESIQTETNTDVDAYRLLLESEGVLHGPSQAGQADDDRRSRSDSWLPFFATSAFADEVASAETGVDVDASPPPTTPQLAQTPTAMVPEFLESLRQTLQDKNVDGVATHYVAFSERQRSALQAYMDVADNLVVELSDIAVDKEGSDLVVSFTRRDRFDDKKTARPVRLEVRLNKILVLHDGALKIGPAK